MNSYEEWAVSRENRRLEKAKKCKYCKGHGMVQIYDMFGNPCRGLKECPHCNGTGKVNNGIKE